MTKPYNRPLDTAFACLFLVFKKERTAYELAELTGAHVDQVRRSLAAAEAEGLLQRVREKRATGRGQVSQVWRRNESLLSN